MPPDKEMLSRLTQSAGLNIDLSTIRPEQTFQEIGLDSMSLINLMYAIEDELGVTLTTDEMMEINTMADMQSLLSRKRTASA